MNTVEKLLKIDSGKIKIPEKNIKMRLQKLNNEEFVFLCRAVDAEYISELQENAIEFSKMGLKKIKLYDTKVMTIIEGCPNIFKNTEIIKHFNVSTPKELVKKLLLPGEMDDLKEEIDKLSGFDKEEEIKEIKN